MPKLPTILSFLILSTSLFPSCKTKNSSPSKETIEQIKLKRGEIISCSASNQQFGKVDFEMSCSENVKGDFNLAIELLHSFEYDESEKAFAKVIDKAPDCAMAYWSVAMSNFHPLWTPPSEPELQKGSKAIEIAKSISNKTERESGSNWSEIDHAIFFMGVF